MNEIRLTNTDFTPMVETKIAVSGIRIISHEGNNKYANTNIKTFKEAQSLLIKIFNENDLHSIRTVFKITWLDGSSHTGELEVSQNVLQEDNSIGEHVQRYYRYITGQEKPLNWSLEEYTRLIQSIYSAEDREKAHKFLSGYILSDVDPNEKSVNPCYPMVDVDDCDKYIIPQDIIDREFESGWIFRRGIKDRNYELKCLFLKHTEQVKEVLSQTNNPHYHFVLKSDLQRFKKKYFEYYQQYLAHKGNNPSWAITGRGNMNMTKYNKAIEREDRLMFKLSELIEDIEKKITKFRKKIKKDKALEYQNKVQDVTDVLPFVTKTINLPNNQKQRVYVYKNWHIVKTWGAFRIFCNGLEVHCMRAKDTLKETKRYATLLIKDQENDLK
ncbi:hypothetical protein LSG23_20635 (plasmid) [Bacillus velezensis]|uniref:hypothetical protein n=1 Tax=Bacillus velezensis TaxID=492670 RepID=UPI0009880B4D|nr:hypothetical protein [Bacillus velezensis]AQS42475.1 hypothetical protein BVH55_00330 [Bacillus velezensis]WNR83183.1 hypothetical protein RP314_20695 [Bacillus velezensis]